MVRCGASGVGFTRAELKSFTGATLPDLIADGVRAYRIAFSSPRAVLGRQPGHLDGAQVWVVPNPSGRNTHAPLATLAAAYREVALAAGVINPGAVP